MMESRFIPSRKIICYALSGGNVPSRLEVLPDGHLQGDVYTGDGSFFTLDRTAYLPGDVPASLVGSPGHSAFEGGWDNAGDDYQKAGYFRDGAAVYLQGVIFGGTPGETAFTLPLGFRNGERALFPLEGVGSPRTLEIDEEGRVIPSGPGGNWGMDGVRYLLGGGWEECVLEGSWEVYEPYGVPSYQLDSRGVLWFKGAVTGGEADSVLFTLPPELTPDEERIVPAVCMAPGAEVGRLDFRVDGSVVFSGGSGGWISLWGISFLPDSGKYRGLALAGEWEACDGRVPGFVRAGAGVYLKGALTGDLPRGNMARLPFIVSYSSPSPLVEKPVRAADFLEAMETGQAVRERWGLDPRGWGDSVPAAEVGRIRAQHMADLRALAEGLVNYGGDDFSFTDSDLQSEVSRIRAVHMEEVRQVLDDGGSFARCFGCHSTCGESCGAACTLSCSSSCYGDCAGFCQEGCSASCNLSCSVYCHTGCSVSCGSSCSGTCSNVRCGGQCGPSCSANCYGGCSWTCVGGLFVPSGVCTDGCWGNCKSSCYGSCSGSCAGNCQGTCRTGCGENCEGACSDSCAASCLSECSSSSCSLRCFAACVSLCGASCESACRNDCDTGCTGGCYDSCLSSCYAGCAATARLGMEAGSL